MSIRLTTAYLPPIAYMARAIRADAITIEAWETYAKQTCRNHCSIFSPNGRQTLTIPVIKVNGNHTLSRDIRVSKHQPWQKIHWRSIETAYNNSPFFLYYQDNFIPFFEKEFDFLIDFNMQLLEVVLKSLKVNLPAQLSSDFLPELPMDQREWLVSKKCHAESPEYVQVFSEKSGFMPNLSVIDLIFNLGPESQQYLINLK